MAINAQGSSLFFIDPAAPTAVIEVGCIRSFDGLSANRDQNDVTCLRDLARRFEAGMLNPGAVTFEIHFDPADASHAKLHELFVSGTSIEWALGWADGAVTIVPTATSGDFTIPTTRTFVTFDGYISDFPMSFPLGGKVTSTLTVQMSGMPELHVKTP